MRTIQKRITCILLALCCILSALLTGCGSTQSPAVVSTKEAVDSGIDYNQYINSVGCYAYSDSAYFTLENGVLYFLEPTLSAPLSVLCSKANCQHTDPNVCSAYLPQGCYSVYAWNDAIYCVGWDFTDGLCLYRMDLDGQNRERTAILNVESYSGAVSYIPYISCGNLALYFVDTTPEGDVNKLYLFSMEHPEADPVSVFSNEAMVKEADVSQSEIPTSYPIYLAEDWVFYLVEQGASDARQHSLWGYQISTGTNQELLNDGFFAIDDLALDGDTLLWYDLDGYLYSIDLTNSEVTKISDVLAGENIYGSLDDQWLYINDLANQTLTIYDHTGQEMQTITNETALSFAFSTSGKVFFRDYTSGSQLPVGYLDKQAIASGSAALITLE